MYENIKLKWIEFLIWLTFSFFYTLVFKHDIQIKLINILNSYCLKRIFKYLKLILITKSTGLFLNKSLLYRRENNVNIHPIDISFVLWGCACMYGNYWLRRDFLPLTLLRILWLMVWNETSTLSNITIFERFVSIRLPLKMR